MPNPKPNSITESGEMSMEQKESISNWRRVWVITAIILSVLVVILSLAGIAGTWIGRGVAINVNDSLMEGVDQLASASRQGATQLGEGVSEIQSSVGEVESAVDEVAENISDKGLVLTLLPPEKEQKVVDAADNVSETLESITSAINAAFDLYTAIDDIPLINLPKPDDAKVQSLDDDIQEINNSVDRLAADIQELRDDAASKVSEISATINQVYNRLEVANQNLSELDSYLADVQTQANEWQDQFRTITAIASIFLSFIFIWIIYAQIILIMIYWKEMKA
jgi:methyl-accepting chemotaxis protein